MTDRACPFLQLMVAALFLCVSAQAWPLGLRCGSRVVGAGLISAQVRNACGAPFWTENYTSLEILGAGGPIEEQREVNWDIWYYNFGSRNLMQRLAFRDGRLQSVESLGYGVDEIGTACAPLLAARGLSVGELVARCGEPASRERAAGATLRRLPGVLFANEDRREDWLYDDGSAYLTRYVIVNGRVAGAERLPR